MDGRTVYPVKRRFNPTLLLFGLMGSLLLINLLLPIVNLLLSARWQQWAGDLMLPQARAALKVSIYASTFAMCIMTVLGVPLGYLLARVNLPAKRLWISLVFLPMVVPDLAGGILLLQTFGPYGMVGNTLGTANIELTNN